MAIFNINSYVKLPEGNSFPAPSSARNSGKIKGPTLVVCPAAAMLQWHNEIIKFTQPGLKLNQPFFA